MNNEQRDDLLNPDVAWFKVSQALLASPSFLDLDRDVLVYATYVFLAGTSYAMDQGNAELRVSHLVNGPCARLAPEMVEKAVQELERVGLWRVVSKEPHIVDTGQGAQIAKRKDLSKKRAEAARQRGKGAATTGAEQASHGSLEEVEDPFG